MFTWLLIYTYQYIIPTILNVFELRAFVDNKKKNNRSVDNYSSLFDLSTV